MTNGHSRNGCARWFPIDQGLLVPLGPLPPGVPSALALAPSVPGPPTPRMPEVLPPLPPVPPAGVPVPVPLAPPSPPLPPTDEPLTIAGPEASESVTWSQAWLSALPPSRRRHQGQPPGDLPGPSGGRNRMTTRCGRCSAPNCARSFAGPRSSIRQTTERAGNQGGSPSFRRREPSFLLSGKPRLTQSSARVQSASPDDASRPPDLTARHGSR